MWKSGLILATGVLSAVALFAPLAASMEGTAYGSARPAVVASQTPYDVETDPSTEPTKFSVDPTLTSSPEVTETSSENQSGISRGFLAFLVLLLSAFIALVALAVRHSGR